MYVIKYVVVGSLRGVNPSVISIKYVVMNCYRCGLWFEMKYIVYVKFNVCYLVAFMA